MSNTIGVNINENQLAIIINRDIIEPRKINFSIGGKKDSILNDIAVYELHDFALQISADILLQVFNTNEVGNVFNYPNLDISDEEKDIFLSVLLKMMTTVLEERKKHIEHIKMIKNL